MKKLCIGLIALLFVQLHLSCSDEKNYEEIETSPVVMDLTAVPYPKLSDYHFFDGELKNMTPVFGLMPYKPTTELFSDYSNKQRYIWLPENTISSYDGDHEILNLPVGAALIKTFYYDNVAPSDSRKIIETRLLIKKQDGWIAANYVWNVEQNEAFLEMGGSTVPITFTDEQEVTRSINYQIPSANNCNTCHKTSDVMKPIGIKPQNLNSNYPYESGIQNQLQKLISEDYLDNVPAEINSIVDFKDQSKSLDLRVRSYVEVNCAHCHQPGGSADYVAADFRFSQSAINTNLGVCVGAAMQPPGIPHGMIVKPGDIGQSLMHYTMTSNSNSWKMPRLGRTIVHEEAVQLVTEWINSLPECN